MTSLLGGTISVKPLVVEPANGLKNIGPPPMLIEELIPRGSITLVTGAKYTGKTFFALEAARAVALEGKFMGRWQAKGGNVLIVEQDSPRYDTGRALWAMVGKELEEHDEPPAIYISWHPGLDLMKRLDAARIVATANQLFTYRGGAVYERPEVDAEGNVSVVREEEDFGFKGTSLIVLDSARSLQRGDENDSGEQEHVVQNLKWIRERTGAAILLIAHDNATGEKTRGSTAIDAGVDSEYAIKKRRRQKDYSVYVRKARAIAPSEFRYTITTEEKDRQLRKTVAFKEIIEDLPEADGDGEPEMSREQVMAYIAKGPRKLKGEGGLEEFAQQAGISIRSLGRYLTDAVTTGYLEKDYEKVGRTRYVVYRVKSRVNPSV